MIKTSAGKLFMGIILIAGTALGPGPLARSDQAGSVRTESAVQTVNNSASFGRAHVLDFHSVNGVTLNDNRKTIAETFGVPLDIIPDRLLDDTETYDYGYMSVTFSGAAADIVSIPSEAGSFFVDGAEVAIRPDAIHDAFGDPDYVTEDGLVYERGEYLIKVFLDLDRKEIEKIDYFSKAGV